MVLAMTALGCEGRSRAELMQALDIPDDETLRSSFAYLKSSLQAIDEATLDMANKIYVKKDGKLKPGIQKDAEEVFASSLEQVDFNEKETAAGIINKWVAEKTRGLIKDVIGADSLNDKTDLILVNAIYFKGNWKVSFNVKNTKNRSFHVKNSIEIKVPMMYKMEAQLKYGVIAELKAKILEMDYKGNEASMVVVLPDDIEGLSGVLQQLAGGYDLMADVGALRYSVVNVMIPKFKVEMTIDLKELLPKLGIKSIFDEDLSEIHMLMSGERLVVSEAVQKAFIVVDESGTEAAAVTTKRYMVCCSIRDRPPPQRFVADRPFFYLLMVRGIPVFVGVYEGSQFSASSKNE